MTELRFISMAEQKKINDLRMELSMTMINLSEVVVHDSESRRKKSHAIEGIRTIGKHLDDLGLRHSKVSGHNNIFGTDEPVAGRSTMTGGNQ